MSARTAALEMNHPWTNTLAEFYGAPISIRSPGDRSAYWPLDDGGQGLAINGKHRTTSYGMNNYLSRTYNPGISPREPFDRLDKIDRPSLTVQFLLMTEDGPYAVSDHTHAEGWGDASRAPATASTQVHINKYGGPPRSRQGLSNYGFLDGHASTLAFERVYTDRTSNAFNPSSPPLAVTPRTPRRHRRPTHEHPPRRRRNRRAHLLIPLRGTSPLG